jgi:ribosomal protein L7Ae-like RNA K-turn-binding protein
MKKNNHHKYFIILLFFSATAIGKIQAQDSAEVPPTILSLRYFLPENKVPYIIVNTKKKVGRKFEPVKNLPVNVFYNEVAENNLLGKITTAENGEGRIAFPPSFKNKWDSLTEFKFVAESVPAKGEELLTAEITVKKAILVIDTLADAETRTVTAQLKEKVGNEWVAIKEIEMKLGIKRLLGNLTVGDAETYTSDSTGIASALFNKDSMPGDGKGNLILVARVEDNDNYGNLVVEKSVPWGKTVQADTHFWHRTLWSTGGRAPVWLLFLALSIIIGVWGTLIYLVRQMFKVKKMGKVYDRGFNT